MQAALISALVKVLLSVFTEELMQKFADTLLDFVEDRVKGTASPVDDALVLPICSAVRKAFDIPDND